MSVFVSSRLLSPVTHTATIYLAGVSTTCSLFLFNLFDFSLCFPRISPVRPSCLFCLQPSSCFFLCEWSVHDTMISSGFCFGSYRFKRARQSRSNEKHSLFLNCRKAYPETCFVLFHFNSPLPIFRNIAILKEYYFF